MSNWIKINLKKYIRYLCKIQITKVLSVRFCISISVGLFPIFWGYCLTLRKIPTLRNLTLEKHFIIIKKLTIHKIFPKNIIIAFNTIIKLFFPIVNIYE